LQSSFDTYPTGQTEHDQVNERTHHSSGVTPTLGRLPLEHNDR
jgi:hypothetical protein